MEEKTTQLASREVMLRRLLALNEDVHIQQRMYPHFLREAGETKNGTGVAMIIETALHEYTEGMSPMLSGLVYMNKQRYIDPICPDGEVADEARAFMVAVAKQMAGDGKEL